MSTGELKRHKVGELRPSQTLTTYGVGSIIDLPNLSVMVMGLEDWPIRDAPEIAEPRLLASVKAVLGQQVQVLRAAPVPEKKPAFGVPDSSAVIGIPVAPFPRWMVCPYCRRLAPLSSGLFKLVEDFRTDHVRYVHENCNQSRKPPTVIPARFVVACKNGHLDDFPWHDFVHRGAHCNGGLRLSEIRATGEASSILVSCDLCASKRLMSDAFRQGANVLPSCKGRRPHLRDKAAGGCKGPKGEAIPLKPMLQGASNAWFGMMLSALSIPQATGDLAELVDENWATLEKVQSEREIELLQSITPSPLGDLATYKPVEIWEGIQSKKAAIPAAADPDLKIPEWEVLKNPDAARQTRHFQLRKADPPKKYAKYFEKIVLAERLREVRALVGFTRIESPGDYDSPTAFPASQRAPLSRNPPFWAPASEIRGEGLFFQFKEELVQKWARKKAVAAHADVFLTAHSDWRGSRNLEPPEAHYPGVRLVLLHSFAHALIRQLAVECGYTAASLRERIYSNNPGGEGPEMAGVLIYTAAPDSEGTLGGLVSLGQPKNLERHLDQALDAMRLCASDPLCAEHHPDETGTRLYAAACHACAFAPETSCERGNRYLDRAVLVPTVERADLAFFGDLHEQ